MPAYFLMIWEVLQMKKDVVIIGAGPAGIFTAIEMIKKGSKQSILIVEKGQPVEKRHCPKARRIIPF